MLLNRVHGSFWPGFATNFNRIKSVHDFVFTPWGETLGCVQSPLQRN